MEHFRCENYKEIGRHFIIIFLLSATNNEKIHLNTFRWSKERMILMVVSVDDSRFVFASIFSFSVYWLNWFRSPSGHAGAHSSSNRRTAFRYGFLETVWNWFETRFLLFGWCVRNIIPIGINMYLNHTVLKTQLAQWVLM